SAYEGRRGPGVGVNFRSIPATPVSHAYRNSVAKFAAAKCLPNTIVDIWIRRIDVGFPQPGGRTSQCPGEEHIGCAESMRFGFRPLITLPIGPQKTGYHQC